MLESINTTIIAIGVSLGLIFSGPIVEQPKQIAVKPQVEEKLSSEDQKQIKCLADNIYYEARNQPKAGKIAVTNVVLNRVEDPRFPKDPCSVIKQKRGKVCQFSWVCSRKSSSPKDKSAYTSAKEIAEHIYINADTIRDVTYGSKFYHAKYVNPKWKYKRVITIGDHIFYRG